MSDSSSKKSLNKLKYGKISRSLDFLGLMIGSGQKALSYKIQSQIKNVPPENLGLEILKKQVEVIAKKLGNLKGGLMKVGQMLSVYGEYFLPKEINDTLKSLQSQSIPFEWSVLEKYLIKELGEDIFEKLSVEKTSLASASIGQVHRAQIISTQENIVLKIQYPNVDKAIESDVSALKSIFKIADLFPNVSHLDMLLEEVESMLKQELDYFNEMNWTRKYSQKLKNDSRYIVPKVYSDFTSTRVIATSFEQGVTVDSSEVASLSQETRNELAFAALELYFKELFEWGFVQTDPHLGNYKIRIGEKPQIILYDFGAVREFSNEFLTNYKGLIKSSLDKNVPQIEFYAEKLRFIQYDDPQTLKDSFFEFCQLMVEPFSSTPTQWHNEKGEYDWAKTDIPRRLTQMVSEVIGKYRLRAPPREVVFLDRKTTGVFIFLSVLKAQIKADDLLKKYLAI